MNRDIYPYKDKYLASSAGNQLFESKELQQHM
jgi:hypothetical protein